MFIKIKNILKLLYNKTLKIIQYNSNRQKIKGNNNITSNGDITITNIYHSEISDIRSKQKKNLKEIDNLLNENYLVWKNFGPKSEIALKDLFNVQERDIWEIKKKDIVLNNDRIVKLIPNVINLFNTEERVVFSEFKEHADLFKRNSESRIDSLAYRQFPNSFPYIIKGKIEEES